MVFVVGLMFQVTSPLASVFIALHHNVSVPIGEAPAGAAPLYGAHGGEVTLYTTGIKDVPAIFFYLLIAIVMHQVNTIN
jgi:translocating chain-associated membrane protein 1